MIPTYYSLHTRNRKTGAVRIVTYRPRLTCPDDCPFMGMGCYAESGPGGSLFKKTAHGDATKEELIAAIESIRTGTARFNVAGDYLLEDGTPDLEYIEATNHAYRLDVLSYTHAWRRLDPRMFHPRTLPNASCESVAEVAEARAAGWPVVLTAADDSLATADGAKVVTCVYDTHGTQCVDCGLCARQQRKSVVRFVVHGSRKNVAKRQLEVINA